MRFLWEVFRREIVRILRKASMRFLWEVFRRTNPGRSQLTIPSWEPDKPGTQGMLISR
jgi:hypothetical protein